jgi:hypothetical protein
LEKRALEGIIDYMSEDNKNKIEDIKRHLYDPNDHALGHQHEGVLHQVNHEVKEEWKEDELLKEETLKNKTKKPPMSAFKKFFIFAVLFFVASLVFVFYRFSTDSVSVSNDKIDIQIIGSSFVKGGDELPLQVEITNNNLANLEFANLIVEYPKGVGDNLTEVVRLPREAIGTIRPNETVIRNVKVVLFGEEKSIRNIKVSLEYHPQGSNAIFTKDKFYPITISLAPLSLIIDGPSSVVSNQPISFRVTANLNTSLPGNKSILQLTYPNNFIFESAIPAPFFGNTIWDLSSISPTSPVVINVKGRLIGADGDEQVFHAYAGSTSETNPSSINTTYSSILQRITIAKPFLEANILVNNLDQTEYAVNSASQINVSISWANNLSTRITDGQIIASLSGNAFDKSSVRVSNGHFDSLNNQIIWDRNSIPDFAEINPGGKGSVSFSLKPLPLIGLTSIKDPQLSVNVSIKGREPLQGSSYNEINNFTEKTVKIISDFQIASSASYSSGSLPPKAETETRYVVNWTLSNSANSINQAEARSALPIYVKWVGLTIGEDEKVTYNDVTREVTWNIGNVSPYTGINSNREASFIIALNPSTSQVGSIPQLMKEIFLSGTDSFTNTLIKVTRGFITTSIGGSVQTSERVVE